MATSVKSQAMPLLLILFSQSLFFPLSNGCYTSIISFGDSQSDTGNLLAYLSPEDIYIARAPYGETYFHRPTGRFCDGRLVIDYLAEAIGLPLVAPYLAGPGNGMDFKKGVNFAVAAATAADSQFYWDRGIPIPWMNYSLEVQVGWFRQLLPSLCSSLSECESLIGKSLVIIGEIGGNDLNYPLMQGKTVAEVLTYLPGVIKALSTSIQTLIGLGARTILIPGDFPTGCNPAFLTTFPKPPEADYKDYYTETGCVKWLNEFAKNYNSRLKEELVQLRELYPHVTIIYADYFKAFLSMFIAPQETGYNNVPPLASCCGGGGPYNYNASLHCGNDGYNVCNDPAKFVTWDGHHLTEFANAIVTRGLLDGSFASQPVLEPCSHFTAAQ